MTTLAKNINSRTPKITVAGSVAGVTGGLTFRLDSEILQLVGFDIVWAPDGHATGQDDHAWIVRRGMLGSVKAVHSAGVTLAAVTAAATSAPGLTPPAPFLVGGGGSISVTDGTTTVNPATSLRLPAGTLSDLGSGVGGVGLLTMLIGPYHVDYTDNNINNDVIPLGPALPDKSFVIGTWALFPTAWVSDTTPGVDFAIELASITPYLTTDSLKDYVPAIGVFTRSEPVPFPASDHTHTVPSGTDANGGTTGGTGSIVPPMVGIVDYAAWSAAAGTPVTSIQLGVEVYVVSGDHFVSGSADVYAIIATPAA